MPLKKRRRDPVEVLRLEAEMRIYLANLNR